MAQGEPNLEGAIKVLVDLLTANSFTMTRSPYANNFRGLVEVFHRCLDYVILQKTIIVCKRPLSTLKNDYKNYENTKTKTKTVFF